MRKRCLSVSANPHTRTQCTAASAARSNSGERRSSNHGSAKTPVAAGKHIRWFLYRNVSLLRRTPGPTATTQRPTLPELARGLRETWSSCCSPHCTCPRRLKYQCLKCTRQRNPPHTHAAHSRRSGTQQRRRTVVFKSRQHKNTRRSWQTHTLVPIPE